ncbi:endonuclease/exonuclease/phosphatase family protein [Sphingomonas sp. Leaf38]|uniref:endonuclease/exonuclease/phosphatase family protein n=1 Tax=Sphingomonas sp. Leaf38 TaxID=1736217 RepID=UPI0006FA36CD|nr:endonuclease/exonuclease/phosphatase family protein [Sphingomonas sp. Leaf38]KQN32769.1 endonuclease [Sphingomonas sp. Leaf38]
MPVIVLRFAALLLLCLAGPVLARASDATRLRVMTFNVRYPNPDDGVNVWANRRALFVQTVAAANPDIIGTQELFATQGADVVHALPRYSWFGRDRRGGHADEHMGIFYRRDRLRLIRHGDYWLSDTPAVIGSMAWGATLPRMVTWGIFEARATHRRFVVFDTHFAHRDEDDGARERSAAMLMAELAPIAGALPIVVTGDMNATPDSAAYRLLAGRLTDAWVASPVRVGPDRTFHDFTGTPDRRIDYIFVRGFTPLAAAVRTDHAATVYPSDHFPVVAELRFDAIRPGGRG